MTSPIEKAHFDLETIQEISPVAYGGNEPNTLTLLAKDYYYLKQAALSALSAPATAAGGDIEGLGKAINNLGDAKGDWAQLNEKDMRDLRTVLEAARRYAAPQPAPAVDGED